LPVTFFMLLINLLGIIGFYLFSRYVAGSSISLLHSSALLSFIIPFLIHKVFQLELQMPKREYEKWLFPKEFMVMDSDMHEHLIISLYVTKSFGSEVFSKFTIRAPLHQSLGDVFCYFVNGYNQQQIENGIKDLEKNGEERGVGWIFYTKSLLTGMKKVIDPKKTIKENGFREKHVVYTERIHL